MREADGLALSSRNVRLAPDERAAATVLSRALAAGRAAVEAGERSAAALHAVMAALVATEPLVELDYAAAVDGASLVEHETVADPARDPPARGGAGRVGAPHRQLRRAGRRPPKRKPPCPPVPRTATDKVRRHANWKGSPERCAAA